MSNVLQIVNSINLCFDYYIYYVVLTNHLGHGGWNKYIYMCILCNNTIIM